MGCTGVEKRELERAVVFTGPGQGLSKIMKSIKGTGGTAQMGKPISKKPNILMMGNVIKCDAQHQCIKH